MYFWTKTVEFPVTLKKHLSECSQSKYTNLWNRRRGPKRNQRKMKRNEPIFVKKLPHIWVFMAPSDHRCFIMLHGFPVGCCGSKSPSSECAFLYFVQPNVIYLDGVVLLEPVSSWKTFRRAKILRNGFLSGAQFQSGLISSDGDRSLIRHQGSHSVA